MKSENFVMIQGWMCNELALKGNDLLVYALIYGFSQDGESVFRGSRTYISNTFNISLPTVDKALKNLCDNGYIIKYESDDYSEPNMYAVDIEVVKKLYMGCKETLQGGSKETLLNKSNKQKNRNQVLLSKDNNTTQILQDFTFGSKQEKSKKDNLYSKCLTLISEFTDDTILQEMLVKCLQMFLANSREAGTPFYTNTFRGKLNKLKTLSGDNYVQRDIVKQTIDNGWNGFYELKVNKPRKNDIEYVSAELGIVQSITYTEEEKKQQEEWLKEMERNGKQIKF